ncbi:alpha/beta fold hydrolase [Streptomyces sp. NPDC048496]|uniref:alpha/beta fold hydrolase n=1 Tax=Streptomyces sp. NPDC048496 TaxID=3365558 RepID=UPI003724A485
MGDTMSGHPLPLHRWPATSAPVLVLDGGASDAWSRGGAKALGDLLPGASHRTLDGQDHGVDPRVLAPALKDFFTA